MEANQTRDKMNEIAESASRMQDTAKNAVADVSNKVMEKSRAAASSTDAYIHEYAWSSIALAALVGVLVGLMVRRS
jgi:ElaB/YqjD/DUF883 family membrane-anchored ribosome-binding protein